jgi:hypothetical protein
MLINQQKTQTIIRVFLILGALEGFFGLIWFLSMPSDPKSALLFGYSRYRLLFMLGNLVAIGIFGALMVLSYRSPGWLTRTSKSIHKLLNTQERVSTLWIAVFILLYLGGAALWLASKDHWVIWVKPIMYLVGDYLSRIAPLLVWLVLLCAQTLVMLWLLRYRIKVGYRMLQIIAVMIYPSLMLFFASLHPNYYVVINREDNIIEWLTVVFLLLTTVVALVQMVIARRRTSPYVVFFVLFGLACVLFAVEEISWGQRMFGIESPEFFMTHSDQQEINIHNVINEQFSVRTKHIAAWFLFVYGAIFPLLALIPQVRSIAHRLRIVIPSKILIPGFTLASLMTWDRYFNGQDEEVAEFFLSTLLFLVLIFHFWKLDANKHIQEWLNTEIANG